MNSQELGNWIHSHGESPNSPRLSTEPRGRRAEIKKPLETLHFNASRGMNGGHGEKSTGFWHGIRISDSLERGLETNGPALKNPPRRISGKIPLEKSLMTRTCVRFAPIVLGLFLTTFSTVSKADVVFGNLGASGTGALSATTTDIVTSATSAGQVSGLAQGFQTGTSANFLTLESVVLGLFSEVGSRTVGLYSSVSGLPGALLATSAPVTVTAQDRYTFGFSSVALTANTPYWIVPDTNVSWYFSVNGIFDTPSAQNGSGYTYVGTAQKTFQSGNTWVGGAAPGYSISVNAVPEPSTYAMAAVAAGLFGWAGLRRRRVLPTAGR